jgi:hypothetical protein
MMEIFEARAKKDSFLFRFSRDPEATFTDKVVSEKGLHQEFDRMGKDKEQFYKDLKSISLTPIAKYGLGKETYAFDFVAPSFEHINP